VPNVDIAWYKQISRETRIFHYGKKLADIWDMQEGWMKNIAILQKNCILKNYPPEQPKKQARAKTEQLEHEWPGKEMSELTPPTPQTPPSEDPAVPGGSQILTLQFALTQIFSPAKIQLELTFFPPGIKG
jgi:hypothetical protein